MSDRDDHRSNTTRFFVSGVVAMSLSALLASAQESPRIDIREARKNVGKSVTVCGTVVTHHCPRPQRTTYLDLDTPYWEEGMSIAIPADNRTDFGARVEDRYASRAVCASGRLRREGKRYIIIVSQPPQLRVTQEPQPPPVRLEPSAVRACDYGVELPQVVTRVKPEFPPSAAAQRRGGIVLLHAVVLTDGNVGDVVVVHSLDALSGLDGEAVAAFKKWRFTPGTVAGRPTPVVVGVQITFDAR